MKRLLRGLVLGLLALFLFQSGDDKMQWVIASLGSIITLSTTVRQLWALMKGQAS